MKTSRFLLLVVGLMALASCGDTASPEPAAVSESDNTTGLYTDATAKGQSTSAAQLPVAPTYESYYNLAVA